VAHGFSFRVFGAPPPRPQATNGNVESVRPEGSMIVSEKIRGPRGQAAFIRVASKGVYADARLYPKRGAGASRRFAPREELLLSVEQA
jgi:hypothetical protein